MRLHPLAELYRQAERVFTEALSGLKSVESRLREVEARLARYAGELARRYGPGYLTVKSVRNRQGKRYRYLVWRTYSGRDIYLKGRGAEEILRLREEQHRLRIQYNRYRRALWAAKLYMREFKEYKDVCIADDGEYVPCPPQG